MSRHIILYHTLLGYKISILANLKVPIRGLQSLVIFCKIQMSPGQMLPGHMSPGQMLQGQMSSTLLYFIRSKN